MKSDFERYDLLDGQVRFLAGWFQDPLPSAPVERLAVLQLDVDMYESTIVALRSLYPKLSVGGYLIVNDYSNASGCKKAVDDFRREQGITENLGVIDYSGVFWQRLRSAASSPRRRMATPRPFQAWAREKMPRFCLDG